MNFRNGENIWHVHAFPDTNKFYINEYSVVVEATMQYVNTPSLIVKSIISGQESEISLRDANVIPNIYNSHRIFKSSLEAENYVSNPDSWRPLGFTEKEWNDCGKADYLLSKILDNIGSHYMEF